MIGNYNNNEAVFGNWNKGMGFMDYLLEQQRLNSIMQNDFVMQQNMAAQGKKRGSGGGIDGDFASMLATMAIKILPMLLV